MAEKLKLHKSIDEQIQQLEDRHLVVEDKEYAKRVLSNVNYYCLSGYLHDFKKEDSEEYQEGISFNQIVRIYEFDTRLSSILMYILEDIEETLKTRVSYSLSSEYPQKPLIYLNKDIYRDEEEFKLFKKFFTVSKKNNKNLPFVKHHIDKYGGKLPIWVAVEILTMGNIDAMYSNLLGKYQKLIAKKYNTGSVQLENWIQNLRYTRNHVAHYMRLYRYSFGRIPKSCSNHPVNTKYNGKIFDQIVIMSFMYSKPEHWNSYILDEIEKLLKEYNDTVKLNDIGFPKDWKKQLTVII